jgi:hypothetical protein
VKLTKGTVFAHKRKRSGHRADDACRRTGDLGICAVQDGEGPARA